MRAIISAGNNGRSAVMETEHLTQSGVTKHLFHKSVYQKLSRDLVYANLQAVEWLTESFISRHRNILLDYGYTYG